MCSQTREGVAYFPERPLRAWGARKLGTRPPPQPPQRPQEHEAENHDPDPDLDHASARLSSLHDELPRRNDTARRPEPAAVRSAGEQEADWLVAGDDQIAIGPGWASDDDVPVCVAFDSLIDLDGQEPLRRSFRLASPLGDHAADDRSVRPVKPLTQGRFGADARARVSDRR